MFWESNLRPLSGRGTLPGGQFDWGGRLLKRNGGVRRFPQADWKPAVECKRIRVLVIRWSRMDGPSLNG
jgi:hypothetical protein